MKPLTAVGTPKACTWTRGEGRTRVGPDSRGRERGPDLHKMESVTEQLAAVRRRARDGKAWWCAMPTPMNQHGRWGNAPIPTHLYSWMGCSSCSVLRIHTPITLLTRTPLHDVYPWITPLRSLQLELPPTKSDTISRARNLSCVYSKHPYPYRAFQTFYFNLTRASSRDDYQRNDCTALGAAYRIESFHAQTLAPRR